MKTRQILPALVTLAAFALAGCAEPAPPPKPVEKTKTRVVVVRQPKPAPTPAKPPSPEDFRAVEGPASYAPPR